MEYTISNDKISLTASSLGGEPKALKGADGTDYLWRGAKEYWPASAPHLFPFIGRLYEERYLYEGESYPLAIHGFLKDSSMELVSQGDNSLVFKLDADETTKRQYPFDFRLYIRYELSSSTVAVTFEVQNLGGKAMPFAIGGHPGFNVPLTKGLRFEDYYLEFSEEAAPKRTESTPSNLLNGNFLDYPLKKGRIIELRHALFDDDAIILKDMARRVTLKSDGDSRAVTVDYPGFKYIGFWHTVRSEAPFVCIEPWTALQGYENTVQKIDENDDMIVLKPGEEYKNEWSITIHE